MSINLDVRGKISGKTFLRCLNANYTVRAIFYDNELVKTVMGQNAYFLKKI